MDPREIAIHFIKLYLYNFTSCVSAAFIGQTEQADLSSERPVLMKQFNHDFIAWTTKLYQPIVESDNMIISTRLSKDHIEIMSIGSKKNDETIENEDQLLVKQVKTNRSQEDKRRLVDA